MEPLRPVQACDWIALTLPSQLTDCSDSSPKCYTVKLLIIQGVSKRALHL
jgi:hypothetical protein